MQVARTDKMLYPSSQEDSRMRKRNILLFGLKSVSDWSRMSSMLSLTLSFGRLQEAGLFVVAKSMKVL